MHSTKSLKVNFLLTLLLASFLSPSLDYAQQEERTFQPQLTREQSLFPLQSTGIWTEVHPLIPRVDYWGVHFVNADTGWAVGEGGAIIKTTNSGGKWIWYESGVGNTLRTVSAVNNGQRVIAAGDGGIILISEDAGETWSQLSSPTTRNLWNMQMITEQIGRIVGEGGASLKTVDGGYTWIQQSMPFPTAPYWDLSFLDNEFGYICSSSGIVLKTTNGGGNWIIQQAGDTRSIYTIFTLDTLRASAGGFAGKVVYTSDGGNNWLYTGGGGISATEINKIKFINDTKGFLASSGGFYKSTNGGVSWYKINDLDQKGSTVLTTNLSFPTEEKGFVTGGKMLLAKTTNEGESWKRTIVNADFLNVYFKDEQVGFMNSSHLIYTTNDGGHTLDTLLTFPYNEIYSMDAMAFSDSITGFIGTTSLKIFKTSNSGLSWYRTNIIGLTDTIGTISKIFFLNSNLGWSVSSDGRIFKTNDGGDNWIIQLDAGINAIFNSIFFIDSLIGWTAVTNKQPYKTTDGGNTWIEQINLNLYSIKDIYFSSYSLGFCTKSNDVYKTVNGGNTWSLDSLDTGLGQSTFTSYDSMNIFITGSKVFRTTNRGENWVEFPELEGPDWRLKLFLTHINTGYLSGEMGWIVKYYDLSVPVELINFEGRLNENETYLQWTTATETNNRGFYIQRKKENEQEWIDLDFIEGKGNSTEINYYSYKDILIESGIYSYRLKQTDFDGSYNYSKEIEIYFLVSLEFELFQNFPNPFNSFTIIKYSLPEKSFVNISLYDIKGEKFFELVNEEKESGYHTVEFNAAKLPSGVYFYQLRAGNFISTKKMIFLK
ncbi:MAG TPA: YCF48-related protein [Ignavibacteriaceae bacterium]|nr:YCF48-related protein [Ignavibacteriaceae bacterium]